MTRPTATATEPAEITNPVGIKSLAQTNGQSSHAVPSRVPKAKRWSMRSKILIALGAVLGIAGIFGGYMLWAELPCAIDLPKVRDAARRERIVFGAGPVFYTEPQSTSSLRLNCAKASESELVSGLERLGAILSAAS